MQFKSEYVFTIIGIMFNRWQKSHANLGNLKKIIQKRFYKIISKDSLDLRET